MYIEDEHEYIISFIIVFCSLYKLAMFSVKNENLSFSQTMYFQLF